jgi:hypothetical protein
MKSKFAWVGGLLTLALLAACGPGPAITNLVTINYTQVGNTDFIASGKQITDGMFMRYHIDSISNNDTNAQPFHFDPSKIFLGSDTTNHPIHHPCIPQDAVAIDVPAHTTTSSELFGVNLKDPGDPSTLKTTFSFINYQSGPNEHVIMAASTANVIPQPPPTLTKVLPVPYKGDICKGQ